MDPVLLALIQLPPLEHKKSSRCLHIVVIQKSQLIKVKQNMINLIRAVARKFWASGRYGIGAPIPIPKMKLIDAQGRSKAVAREAVA